MYPSTTPDVDHIDWTAVMQCIDDERAREYNCPLDDTTRHYAIQRADGSHVSLGSFVRAACLLNSGLETGPLTITRVGCKDGLPVGTVRWHEGRVIPFPTP